MTKKLDKFLAKRSTAHRPLSDVPGIGQKALDQLHRAGITEVEKLYEMFKRHDTFDSFANAMMRYHAVNLSKATFSALQAYQKEFEPAPSSSSTFKQPLAPSTSKSSHSPTSNLRKKSVLISMKGPISRLKVTAFSTTAKFRNFVDEPLENHDVVKIPGIGSSTAMALKRKKQITKAFQLFGKYLRLHKNQDEFGKWMTKFGVHPRYIGQCVAAFNTICERI